MIIHEKTWYFWVSRIDKGKFFLTNVVVEKFNRMIINDQSQEEAQMHVKQVLQ